MITLKDVTYAYPDEERNVLEGIDLHVAEGSITGIVGASGAGKSTLGKILSGFIPHIDGGELSGTVSVGGIDPAKVDLAQAVRHIGLVIQSPFNQISGAKFTVREELAFGLENLGTPREEMVERVAAMADLLGITHLLDRSPYELSGGQQQLVAIASVIIMRTPLLVMDEPTSQLDPSGTRMVFDVLSNLRNNGITVVIIEHKMELLREHCDHIHVLADRRLVRSGPSREVLSDPMLDDWGLGYTRFTEAGLLARERGIVPADAEIPVSLEDAVATFGGGR